MRDEGGSDLSAGGRRRSMGLWRRVMEADGGWRSVGRMKKAEELGSRYIMARGDVECGVGFR